MEKLTTKYGIFVAISMVVGIVIGSGVFFKADDVLRLTDGNLRIALLAWFVGGCIMIVSTYTFSLAARSIDPSNGIVDYMQAGYGKNAAYYTGFFMAVLYYPSLSAVLAYVSAVYTLAMFSGLKVSVFVLAFIYLVLITLLNHLSPKLSGKFQVSTTIIKLIPLALIAVIGLVVGLVSGVTLENLQSIPQASSPYLGFSRAVLATAFAYEGWIVVTSINAELKDSKKNLPKALILGGFIVMLSYMFYYIGLSGLLTNGDLLAHGDASITYAFSRVFGSLAGVSLTLFVVISCLGTLNGLLLATSRAHYSLAQQNQELVFHSMSKLSPKNNAPVNAIYTSLVNAVIWLVVWYGNFASWYDGFIDISELPIAFLYAIYIFVYFWIMRTLPLSFMKRYILPSLSIIGSSFIFFAAVQKTHFITFSIVLVFLFLFAYLLKNGQKKHAQ